MNRLFICLSVWDLEPLTVYESNTKSALTHLSVNIMQTKPIYKIQSTTFSATFDTQREVDS